MFGAKPDKSHLILALVVSPKRFDPRLAGLFVDPDAWEQPPHRFNPAHGRTSTLVRHNLRLKLGLHEMLRERTGHDRPHLRAVMREHA